LVLRKNQHKKKNTKYKTQKKEQKFFLYCRKKLIGTKSDLPILSRGGAALRIHTAIKLLHVEES